jgi:hypothetical protein
VKTACAAFALALSFASPSLAQSPQFGAPPPAPAGVLPPHEVLTSVRSMGLDPVSRPALQGRVYVLRAYDVNQAENRVVVDAWSGEVLSVRHVANSPPGYSLYDRRFGTYAPPRPPAAIARATGPPPGAEPLLDEPLFPRPGRLAPSTGASTQRSVAVTPHPPLPKGRPASPAGDVKDAKDTAATPPQTTAGAPAAPPTEMPSAAALAAARALPGKSIPAPVAVHANAQVNGDLSAKPATQMVPVAPLE